MPKKLQDKWTITPNKKHDKEKKCYKTRHMDYWKEMQKCTVEIVE